MNRAALASLGVVAGVAVWLALRRSGDVVGGAGSMTYSIENAFKEGADLMNQAVNGLPDAFGFIRVANMGKVDKSLVNNPNVRAMFAVIRRGEGTQGANGYRTIYGGGLFNSYADHPNVAVTKWGRTSTAAGAYQILRRNPDVWTETKNAMGLKDFSPASQDLAALGRISMRGVLADVLAGRMEKAIKGNGTRGHGLRWEWASLPDSPYGQGGISWETARSVYLAGGGREIYA